MPFTLSCAVIGAVCAPIGISRTNEVNSVLDRVDKDFEKLPNGCKITNTTRDEYDEKGICVDVYTHQFEVISESAASLELQLQYPERRKRCHSRQGNNEKGCRCDSTNPKSSRFEVDWNYDCWEPTVAVDDLSHLYPCKNPECICLRYPAKGKALDNRLGNSLMITGIFFLCLTFVLSVCWFFRCRNNRQKQREFDAKKAQGGQTGPEVEVAGVEMGPVSRRR